MSKKLSMIESRWLKLLLWSPLLVIIFPFILPNLISESRLVNQLIKLARHKPSRYFLYRRILVICAIMLISLLTCLIALSIHINLAFRIVVSILIEGLLFWYSAILLTNIEDAFAKKDICPRCAQADLKKEEKDTSLPGWGGSVERYSVCPNCGWKGNYESFGA